MIIEGYFFLISNLTVLQIRRANRDYLGLIFHISS